MIKVSEYFDGNVKSLGEELDGRPFTVGIMEPGEYVFGTQAPEYMEVVYGEMKAILPDGSEKTYKKGESFNVPGNSEFKAIATAPVSYLCLYK